MTKQHAIKTTPADATNAPSAIAESEITAQTSNTGFIDEHAALALVPVCKRTWGNWKAKGIIPYVRIGRRCIYHTESAHLDQVRAFIHAKRGFLGLLGGLGTGKGHLAAAITRHFPRPMFIKQSELLRRLRDTYRDKAALDPVDEAQNADLLVLDEVGLSAGGRDELPMLHDVLDHRYNERKPTVLTGNITLDQMQQVIGERMADRLREAAFGVLIFGGYSRRREARERYFEK